MAIAAEQDNRVKIPDGTAAVCAENRPLVKTGHWRISPGRLGLFASVATTLISTSQKTYEAWLFRSLRAMGSAFVAEKRLRYPYLDTAAFYFQEDL